MQLRDSDLDAYVRLVAPAASEERRREILAKLASGEREPADFRVAKGPGGELRAAVRLAPVGETTLVLVGPLLADDSSDGAAAGLVAEAVDRARARGARLISTRPRVDRLGPRYREALLACGFRELGERIEFKTPLADLPGDEGSPLSWRGMDEVGETAAAAILERVAVGDPNRTPDPEDPLEALREYLRDPYLTHDPACVQIGYQAGREVAFVMAQVRPSNGWSRITYMGVVPEARGRGLGQWVHRRGFALMRERGGREYEGGTSTANEAMLRLFLRHGCRESARMFDFEWRSAGKTS